MERPQPSQEGPQPSQEGPQHYQLTRPIGIMHISRTSVQVQIKMLLNQYQYRNEDDPDDPSALELPLAVSNVERARPLGRDELRTIRPNTYIIYRFQVRFLYTTTYYMNNLFLLNLKFVYTMIKM